MLHYHQFTRSCVDLSWLTYRYIHVIIITWHFSLLTLMSALFAAAASCPHHNILPWHLNDMSCLCLFRVMVSSHSRVLSCLAGLWLPRGLVRSHLSLFISLYFIYLSIFFSIFKFVVLSPGWHYLKLHHLIQFIRFPKTCKKTLMKNSAWIWNWDSKSSLTI